jgi:hypothetical protein
MQNCFNRWGHNELGKLNTVTSPIPQVNSTLYLPQVGDVLSYASSIGECPDKYVECQNRCKECQERYEECRGRNGWMITAIVFIILFLLTVGALAILATVFVIQVKKINIMHA